MSNIKYLFEFIKDFLEVTDIVKFIIVIIALIIFIKFVISKINAGKVKKIFIVILILALVWIIFFSVDYIRVKKQKLPVFCFKFVFEYKDGGTIEYIGFGYKVIDFHKLVYGEPQWHGKEMVEEKYICSWNVSYEEALKDIEEKYKNKK